MRGIKIACCLLILLLSVEAKAQRRPEIDKQAIIEQRIDFVLDQNENGDNDYTSLFEQLAYYYDKPININSASREQLIEMEMFNEIQIGNLIKHREKTGRLIALEELQSIDGFDLEFIDLISPFVKVNGDLDQIRASPKTIFSEGSSTLFMRYTRILEQQEGFSPIADRELEESPNARYLGSQDKYFLRYRFNYTNQVSFGITAEKDAGEEFFQNTQNQGFDFYSAHLFLQNFGIVKQLALGDYQAQFGQGLTFWSGLAFGRSPNVFTIKRNAPRLRPYSSVQEDLFLRGAGATLGFGKFDLTVFHSSTKVDANIIGTDTLTDNFIVSSLGESGFHRTPSELRKKNVIRNEFTGAHVQFNHRNLELGLTGVHNEIQGLFQPNTQVYNRFSSLDRDNSNFGFDYSYLIRNVNLFGELSTSADGGSAYTAGALMVLDPSFSLSIQHRNFDKDYKPIQSNAIGESSQNTNEQGTFIGFNAKASSSLSFSAFVDRFEFDWLRFRTDAPSNGKRYLFEVNYKPNKKLNAYFRFRQRLRQRNGDDENVKIDRLEDEDLKNYRFHLSYQISSSIKISSRVEFSDYQLGAAENEKGFLMYQELAYKKLSSPISYTVRYALFDTDSYDSRIYAYENDVLYAFSIPAYSGTGSRFYITSKYHFSRNVDLWLRYAQFYYTDRKEIGSGKDRIDGPVKSEIKAQLRIKF